MCDFVNRYHSSKLLKFWENCVFAFLREDLRWRISTILDFRDPIIGSLKSPCMTSYWSSIEHHSSKLALNCLVFEKIAFSCMLATDRQTDKQMDVDAWSRSFAIASCGLITQRQSRAKCLSAANALSALQVYKGQLHQSHQCGSTGSRTLARLHETETNYVAEDSLYSCRLRWRRKYKRQSAS